MGEVVRDQGRGERYGHDAHEQQQVQDQERPVHPGHVGKDRVVVHPHDPDREEADHVGEILRPRRQQLGGDRAVPGQAQAEHEQRYRDREYAVAERLDP